MIFFFWNSFGYDFKIKIERFKLNTDLIFLMIKSNVFKIETV